MPRPQTIQDEPLIGVFTHHSLTLGRDLIRGITRYAKEHTGWRLYLNLGLDAPDMRVVPKLDGALISMAHPGQVDFARALRAPIVNMSGRLDRAPFPRVCIDDAQAGHMAATHLIAQGFRSLAMFATNGRDNLSILREQGFARACASAGLAPPAVYSCGGRHDYWQDLRRWLLALPKPTGIFAESDYDAALLRQACWENGQSIPDDIALLGAGNDDLLCDAGTPSLSSLQLPMVDIGYRAAETLDLWLRGKPPARTELRFPALRVVERGSTDIVHQEDNRMAKVLALMKQHACSDHDIPWYAAQAGINRRSLEIKMRELLRRSPRQEIVTLRMREACALLATTRLGVEEIALRCGYRHPPNFSRVFRDQMDMSPANWRKAHRLQNPSLET